MSTPEFTSAHTTKFTETVQTAMLMRLGLIDAGPVSHPDILPDEPPTLLGVPEKHVADVANEPHRNENSSSAIVQLVLSNAAAKEQKPKQRIRGPRKSTKRITTDNVEALIQANKIQRSVDAVADAKYPCGDVNPALFYPNKKSDKLVIAASKTICSKCSAVENCGRQAIEDEETFGTWGGITQWERKEILQKRIAEKAKRQ